MLKFLVYPAITLSAVLLVGCQQTPVPLGAAERLFTGANEGWGRDAIALVSGFRHTPVGWLEVPIPAGALATDWQPTSATRLRPRAALLEQPIAKLLYRL